MVYEWKQDRFGADAQRVGEELESIEYKDAESVVKVARKSRGELHKCFEWDDAVAGEEYRKEQARLLMRMIVTVAECETPTGRESVRIRAYESVRFQAPDGNAERNMTYIPTREVMRDPELREQVMERLRSTINEAETTAETYAYLVPSFKETRKKLAEARETIRA